MSIGLTEGFMIEAFVNRTCHVSAILTDYSKPGSALVSVNTCVNDFMV